MQHGEHTVVFATVTTGEVHRRHPAVFLGEMGSGMGDELVESRQQRLAFGSGKLLIKLNEFTMSLIHARQPVFKLCAPLKSAHPFTSLHHRQFGATAPGTGRHGGVRITIVAFPCLRILGTVAAAGFTLIEQQVQTAERSVAA